MAIDYADLGITKEELQDRIVQRIADNTLNSMFVDDEGNVHERADSKFKQKASDMIASAIDAGVRQMIDKYVASNLSGTLLNLSFQKTNNYGEKKGEPQTLMEFIADSINTYLKEQVDKDGKSKPHDSYGWKPEGTRAYWLVNKSIRDNMHEAINTTLKDSNTTIADAISEAVKMNVQAFTKQFKVSYPAS